MTLLNLQARKAVDRQKNKFEVVEYVVNKLKIAIQAVMPQYLLEQAG